MSILCTTLNVAGVGDGWFERRAPALLDGLRNVGSDVLCMQEVAIRGGPVFYDQAQVIATALGLRVIAFSPYASRAATQRAEHDGVALLTRWPLLSVEHRFLPHGDVDHVDNRVALFATVATPVGELHVVTTHLSWRPDEAAARARQMQVILDHIAAHGWSHPEVPLLFLGDFNASENEETIKLAARRFQDCYRVLHPDRAGFTWVRSNPYNADRAEPDRRLDYVFVSSAIICRAADIVLDRPGLVCPSDHAGVCVQIELPTRGDSE